MRAEIIALLAQLDLGGEGPDLTPDRSLQTDPKPYLFLFGGGFVIATFGHLTQTKFLIALGVLMVFLATVGLPIVYVLSN